MSDRGRHSLSRKTLARSAADVQPARAAIVATSRIIHRADDREIPTHWRAAPETRPWPRGLNDALAAADAPHPEKATAGDLCAILLLGHHRRPKAACPHAPVMFTQLAVPSGKAWEQTRWRRHRSPVPLNGMQKHEWRPLAGATIVTACRAGT